MAAHATWSDVQARVGRYVKLFEVEAAHPNIADVEQLLVDCSAELDAALAARGHDPADLPAATAGAARDLVAYGAIGRALAGVPDPPDELEKLRRRADAVWGQAMGNPESNTTAGQKGTIATGSWPGLALLDSTSDHAAKAGGLWTDEPDLGADTWVAAEAALNAELRPPFSKGQTL